MQIVRTFTDNIHMEFGLDKCPKIVLKKVKLVHSQNLTSTEKHKRSKRENTYRYLGIEESEGILHQQMKENLKKEYTRILRMVMKSKSNAINTITAIRALVIPVLRDSFGIINWRLEAIRKIDTKT